MLLEMTRLTIGILLALFHKPVADFIREQDLAFAAVARTRGLKWPTGLPMEANRTLFFLMGIFVALVQMARIYMQYLH